MAGIIVTAVKDQIRNIPNYPEDWIAYLPTNLYKIYRRSIYSYSRRYGWQNKDSLVICKLAKKQ